MIKWVSVKDRLPEQDKEVVCHIKQYKNYVNAFMYRHNGDWFYSGSNTFSRGSNIKYWLDGLSDPEDANED